MTNMDESTESGINRRTVLKGAVAASAFGFVGVPAFSGNAAAIAQPTETLYLSDSGGDNAGTFLTKLYSVDLDTASGRANLTLLVELTDTDFDQVDAIAASLDGNTIYMVDRDSHHLGTYDVSTDIFTDHGEITGLPDGVVLATFSADGTLYVASQNTNELYTIDTSGPSATDYVTITGATVQGADIAFDADGTLYLYSSSAQALYTVDYDSSSSTFGKATFVGETGDFFTGLAVRDAGNGDLVGSNTTTDQIVVIDKANGAQSGTFDMYLDGERYKYGYGDMTVGALDVCQDLTLDLCAGQNIDVGTVTVSEFGGALTVTYDLNDPWHLYESHVDIGDAFEDLHTNKSGNPQVGLFDLSMTHDGVSTYTYTVECGDDALADVDPSAETLYIAVHGVVVDTETDAQETAWTCVDQDGVSRFVDRGNWATYFEYERCDAAGGLDCSAE